MKILIHTQYYPPEMGAPQARLSDLAKRLGEYGHDITILTALPNYPTGRVFKTYRRLFIHDRVQDISVLRTWIYPSNRASLMHRLFSYLSFSVSSLVGGLLFIKKQDVILTESPPIFLGLAGLVLAKLKKARWIMNVSDLWPDSSKYIGMMSETHPAYRILKWLAIFLYQNADMVTGQSAEIVTEIRNQADIRTTYHLSNSVDVEKFHPKFRKTETRKAYLGEVRIGAVYAGLHGVFQGLDQIIHAARLIDDTVIRFLLFGDGPEKKKLIRMANAYGVSNVQFHPPTAHDNMPAILASMDIGLIPLKSKITGAVPSKIYESMASGIPIVVIAEGEPAELVENTRSGIAVKPGNIQALAAAIRCLIEDLEYRERLGKNGRNAAVSFFNRRLVAEKFAKELTSVIKIHKNT